MLHLTCFLLLTSCEQTGFLGLWGDEVDAINYYSSKIEILSKEVSYNSNLSPILPRSRYSVISLRYNLHYSPNDFVQISLEADKTVNHPKSIMPAAFVSFKSRWGAAVCAQTQQSRNPTIWLTEWAPEPRDVYWDNLAIPFVSLAIRRLIAGVAFFFLTFFFMIPIALVQSLANLESIEKTAPFLKPIIEL